MTTLREKDRMEYAHWIRSARKFPWLALLLGASAIAFDRSVAAVVVVSVAGIFLAMPLAIRSGTSIGRFFGFGWLMIACFLLCLGALVIAIARFEGTLSKFRVDWITLLAVPVLIGLAARYSMDVWRQRFTNLQREITSPSCPFTFFFEHLGGSSSLSFWASPFALAAMTGLAMLGSWLGYVQGDGAQAALVASVVALAWIFLLGSGIAQILLAPRYKRILSVRLVR